jgi:hypothetical protein
MVCLSAVFNGIEITIKLLNAEFEHYFSYEIKGKYLFHERMHVTLSVCSKMWHRYCSIASFGSTKQAEQIRLLYFFTHT